MALKGVDMHSSIQVLYSKRFLSDNVLCTNTLLIGYPRRPYDKARIQSEVFNPPDADSPLCLRFWTHMFGNGIGSLRVLIKSTRGDEEVIWELKGEQGNNWYQGQVTITADSDFQVYARNN